jgi:Outer membrane protein beta-barrel domain
MRFLGGSAPWVFAVAVLTFGAAPALAGDGEATFFIGGLLGGDINALSRGDVVTSFKNGAIYGGRVGWFGYPLALEGSFGYSPNGLNAQVDNELLELDTHVMYLDANALVIILPWAVSPFVTGGVGLQSFDFTGDVKPIGQAVNLATVNKLGFNYGAGVKGNIGRVTVRADVRDHPTKFQETDFGVSGAVAQLLGIQFEETVHNVEVSFGVGIRF